MANSANAVLDVKVNGAQAASREMDRFGQSIGRASRAQTQLAGSANKANQSLRLIRGGAGQLGHQIQDIAVQLQGGTNAMIVFGQQGSQIASLMGPKGALIGAVLAVGAAIYTSMSSMKSASEAADILSDKVKNLASSLDDATTAMYQFNIADASKELREMEKSIEANTKRFHELSNATGEIITEFGENDYHVRKNREEMEELGRANAKLADSYATLVNALHPKTEAEKKAEAAIKANKQATIDKIDALWDENATYGMSAEQLVAYTLKKQGATEAQIEEAVALQRSISELDAEAKAREEAAKKIEDQIKQMERLRDAEKSSAITSASTDFFSSSTDFDNLQSSYQTELELFQEQQAKKLALVDEHEANVNSILVDYSKIRKDIADETAAYEQNAMLTASQSVIGSMQQQMATLDGLFEKQTGLAKAFYVAQQVLAAGQAIISGELAAANILANYTKTGLPGGEKAGMAMANVARAMGYASAGAIMGQTIASFEGGGYTGKGIRSGGMDGKGGRLAMVHPNEKITDLEKNKGSAAPINVSLNISAVDTKGFDKLLAEKQGMIVSMINRAVNDAGRRSLA